MLRSRSSIRRGGRAATPDQRSPLAANLHPPVADIGPRDENQDRAALGLHDDGTCLIAVADELGGNAGGAAASTAAIDALPDRISTTDEMLHAFSAAHKPALELSPEPDGQPQPSRSHNAGTPLGAVAPPHSPRRQNPTTHPRKTQGESPQGESGLFVEQFGQIVLDT